MKVTSRDGFLERQRSMLREHGRMTAANAEGMIIDLHAALERADLSDVVVRWRGGEEGLFTATATLPGPVRDALSSLLAELDDVAYGEDQAVVTADVADDGFHLDFATWSLGIGLCTARIDVRPSPSDIPAR